MNHFLYIFIFSCFSIFSFSQDIFFNQYNHAPLIINPALTGDFDGNLRVNAIYRNKGQNPFINHHLRSVFLSVDSKYKISETTKIGYGFTGLNDASGMTPFNANAIGLSGAITRIIGDEDLEYHVFSLGVSSGLIYKPDLRLFDTYFWDLTIGGFYRFHAREGWSIEVGGALVHANESFSERFQTQLNKNYNLYVRGEFPLFKKLSILPIYLYQGANNRTILGNTFKYELTASKKLKIIEIGYQYLGTQRFRNVGHGIRGTVGFSSFRFGLLYDFYPVVNLQPGILSAFELSFAYILDRE